MSVKIFRNTSIRNVDFSPNTLIVDADVSTTGTPTTGNYTASDGITYKVYSFTGAGSVTLKRDGICDVLIIAGGGGGGSSNGGGPTGAGGGAGGVIYLPNLNLSAGTYSISIGNGGTSVANSPGNRGTSTSFSSYTAWGGGGGGGSQTPGLAGGSGGGQAATGGATGIGSAPPNEGKNGGAANGTGGAGSSGGGGGGNTAVGGNGGASVGGTGGAGTSAYSAIAAAVNAGQDVSGTRWFAGGGGGGGGTVAGGNGGGGGGRGNATGIAGTANTGGGGGGAGTPSTANQGGNGGSGIVLVRVKA